jgi:hypothetical protein
VSRQKIAEDPRTPELLRVYAAGCNLIESAARVGMGRDRAREILEDAGILRHSLPWPAARVEQLRRLRASGLRWAEIGRELCVPADRAAKAHRQYVQGLPRDGKPLKGLRALGALYPEQVQLVTAAKSNVRSFKDLKGKSVSSGSPSTIDIQSCGGAPAVSGKNSRRIVRSATTPPMMSVHASSVTGTLRRTQKSTSERTISPRPSRRRPAP